MNEKKLQDEITELEDDYGVISYFQRSSYRKNAGYL